MTSVWMAYAIAITSLAYVAAATVEHLLWIWRAPRRIAWLMALVFAVAAPFAIPIWHGTLRAGLAAAPLAGSLAPQRLTVLKSANVSATRQVFSAQPSVDATPAPRRWAVRVDSMMPLLWVGTSALLLLLAVISYARLKWQSATWREVDIEGTAVVVSPHCGPAVFGILRQRIVIPSWALSFDARARALMLRHEREHLRALDPQCLLTAMLMTLVFPWNAALWLVVRRLRLAIELDCDDRVLHEGADARVYGTLLLAVSSRRSREMPFAVALVERSSMLERRIRAMTAVTPRRRFLVSMPMLLGVMLLSVAAVRTPSPRPPSLGRHSAAARETQQLVNTLPRPGAKQDSSVERTVARATPPISKAAGEHLPRLASPESLTRMSALWENAPIALVIEAFTTISHRRITTAPGTAGLITATVIDQPWPQALEAIMARLGLRVEFQGDSTIYISPQQESAPRSSETEHGLQLSRTVSGLVEDAQTGTPISDARITVAGVQLLDGPNEAASDKVGRFSLRVPDGEVWLDACAPGYAFRRVTLAPTTSVAVFQGTKNAEPSPDTVRVKDVDAIEIVKGRLAPIYGIQITAKNGTVTRIPIAASGAEPVLVIDGVVVNDVGGHGCGFGRR